MEGGLLRTSRRVRVRHGRGCEEYWNSRECSRRRLCNVVWCHVHHQTNCIRERVAAKVKIQERTHLSSVVVHLPAKVTH